MMNQEPMPAAAPPARPEIDYSQFGELGETVPLSRIQKLTAEYLSRNWTMIPHVTHNDEADITELDALRKVKSEEVGRKLTLTPYLMKALAAQLRKYPKFNTSLDSSGQHLIFKKYCHVGLAVDTPNGLLVAVVRDCDQKSIAAIAEEVDALATKARARGLPMKDMVGGCITLSSLGHIGGTSFTPIVNAPEVAILGVTRAEWKPCRMPDGGVTWRLMLPLSLSYDHRVINGADAARFTRDLAVMLGAEID
jgi:pyruvate dehydrogenase E2 component (dihydrolipoamide acetyltransferase)